MYSEGVTRAAVCRAVSCALADWLMPGLQLDTATKLPAAENIHAAIAIDTVMPRILPCCRCVGPCQNSAAVFPANPQIEGLRWNTMRWTVPWRTSSRCRNVGKSATERGDTSTAAWPQVTALMPRSSMSAPPTMLCSVHKPSVAMCRNSLAIAYMCLSLAQIITYDYITAVQGHFVKLSTLPTTRGNRARAKAHG